MVANTSLDTDGMLIRCYSRIYAALDHQLTFLMLILEHLVQPSQFFCTDNQCGLCLSLCLSPPSLFPVSLCTSYLLLLSVDCCYLDKVHSSPEISLLLSCSHSHTGNQHGGQLHCQTMLAINHLLDCQTHGDSALEETCSFLFSSPLSTHSLLPLFLPFLYL